MARPWGYGGPTTASALQIDVRWLKREGMLRRGRSSRVGFTRNGQESGSCIVKAMDDAVEIHHGGERTFVRLVQTPVHLCGERPWFSCPRCFRQAAILYGPRFACRECKRMAYPSQRECSRYRPVRQAQRIRMELGGTANITAPFPPKPKGMHWVTYWKRQAKAARYEQRALGALCAHMGVGKKNGQKTGQTSFVSP